MSENNSTTSAAADHPRGTQKLQRFEAPPELAPQFGVLFQSEERIQGVCPTDQLRSLVDAFGLRDRTEITIPFQHIKRAHGEIWRMRIEGATMHTVDNNAVIGHQWMYERSYPEQVRGAQ